MFLRFLLTFTLLWSVVFGETQNYPKLYKQLGTPLFSSVKHFEEYEDVSALTPFIKEYKQKVQRVLPFGYLADKSKDTKSKKEYLHKLRKLQKAYDFLLENLHQSISKSIDNDDYALFLKLTSYAFDGLFLQTNLRNKAITFYFKHKNERKEQCSLLDKKLQDEKLCQETSELFAVEIIHASYDSRNQKKSKKSVDILIKRVQNRIEVSFYNKNIYDVTIRVKAKLQNITQSIYPKKEFVLQANSTQHYMSLHLGKGASHYSFNWVYMMGSKYAKHNNKYIYRLPYALGTSHFVSQGYNGTATHKGSSAYSIDFPMPVGTKIYAAREGLVIKTKSNSDRGGYDKKFRSSGNYVRVLHDDGTIATYYHLKYKGVLVREGEKVSRGQLLAYSGNTGYTSGPHLHFSVFRAVSARARMTVRTKFLTTEGVISEPLRGHTYESKE